MIDILSHTHWDREWFVPARYTREWLVALFDALFALLEREPEYRFVLDGQTLMIEDWLRTLNPAQRTEAQERIARYAGRLVIGPYYLQPDWQIPGGEALIRNIEIGLRDTNARYGYSPSCGWLMDNFGQISQTAQLHRQFGLDALFLWRGIDLSPQSLCTEAIWSSPDGSKVRAVILLDSYRNGMQLLRHPDLFERRIRAAQDRLLPFLPESHLLLMNGYDQETEPENIPAALRAWRLRGGTRQITPEEYLQAVDNPRRGVPEMIGAQRSGRYAAIFPGVLSSRVYLKQLERRAEWLLTRMVEPMAALTGALRTADLEPVWRRLLRNLPHDSICGVSVDPVHRDMETRYAIIGRIARRLWRRCISAIPIRGGGEDAASTTLFTPAMRPYGEMIPAPGADGGYLWIPPQRRIGLLRLRPADALPGAVGVDRERRRMENRFLRLTICDDGSLDIEDLQQGRRYSGLHRFEDGGDAGDSYSYSSPVEDRIVGVERRAEVEFVESGPAVARAIITVWLSIPEELSEDRRRRSRRQIEHRIVSEVVLSAHSPLIRMTTELENRSGDHRLRVLFPIGLKTDSAQVFTQFAVERVPFSLKYYDDRGLPPKVRRILLGAREPTPSGFVPIDGFVDVADERGGLALLAPELCEAELLPAGHTVAVTLVRAIGWLARSDLGSRTGDAGPHIATPEAQCRRRLRFRYGLCAHAGDWAAARLPALCDELSSPSIQVPMAAGDVASDDLWISLDAESDSGVQLSALYPSDAGFRVRLYNPGAQPCRTLVRFGQPVEAVRALLLDGRVDGETQLAFDRENREAKVEIAPYRIVTLEIERPQPTVRSIGRAEGGDGLECATELERQPIWFDAEELKSLIESEEERARGLRERLARVDEEGDRSTLERALLEASLSLLLLRESLQSGADGRFRADSPALVEALRSLGLALNRARIAKRTDDFLRNIEILHQT